MHENEVVILAGSTGSVKSTQVLQFLLEEKEGEGRRRKEKEEKEEKVDDPIGGGGGGSGDPCGPHDGIWEQRRQRRLQRR